MGHFTETCLGTNDFRVPYKSLGLVSAQSSLSLYLSIFRLLKDNHQANKNARQVLHEGLITISTCHYSRLILINIQNQGRDKPQGVRGAQVCTGSRDNIYRRAVHAHTHFRCWQSYTLSINCIPKKRSLVPSNLKNSYTLHQTYCLVCSSSGLQAL